MKERLERAWEFEQFHVLPDQDYVGHNKQPYATAPLNEFQRGLRKGCNNELLYNHTVHSWFDQPSWTAKDGRLRNARTEQICSVPFQVGSDHRDLPEKLRPWFMYHQESAAARNRFYPGRMARANLNEVLHTLLTDVSPSGKNKGVCIQNGSLTHKRLTSF